FLPSFVFVALLSRILPLARSNKGVGAALDGINAASVGLIGGVVWQLGRAAVTDVFTIAVLLVSFLIVWRTKVNTVWVIAAAAVVGVVYRVVG
ncbi:MAG: chromate transporter, partial [SAR202 cluster bacterium]|nr:chromate transporter [SAR202 cluster bacterium]